jgi:hypothetical protein
MSLLSGYRGFFRGLRVGATPWIRSLWGVGSGRKRGGGERTSRPHNIPGREPRVLGGGQLPAIELKFHLRSGLTRCLWVDAQTYLPLRQTLNFGGFTSVQKGTVSERVQVVRADYQYLAPTAANLAKLTVPIPPGFRRTAQLPPNATDGG